MTTGARNAVSSNQAALWHPENFTYRCFLSDLTGFINLCRTRPGFQRHFQSS